MVSTTWRNWLVTFGFVPSPTKRVLRDRWHFQRACEHLEDRAMLSAASAGPVAAEVAQVKAGKAAKAAQIPNIAGDWLLTGIAVNVAFTDAALTITQSGKTGKSVSGSATFTGGSIEFTGKLRPNGHITGKTTIQFGEQTISKQRFFADLNDDLLTFSGEVNLKALDDLMNIDGTRVGP